MQFSSLRTHFAAALLRAAATTFLATAFCCGATSAAYAQSASQITPHSFAPAPRPQGGEIVIPKTAGPEAPAGANLLFVRIAGARVEGGLAALKTRQQAILDEIIGKRVSVAELFAVARRLERAYVVAGYGLARVVLPAQRLRDGATVRFVVINGYVERIDASALPPAIRGRIADVLTPLVGRRGLTMSEIERALLLAGDTPGAALRSTLAPGSRPGAGVLVLEARYRPVTGFVSFDNTLPGNLGAYTAGFGLNGDSLFGFGEQIYLRAVGQPWGARGFFTTEPRNRMLAGGVTLPLGVGGLNLNLEVTDSRTTPMTEDDGLRTTSLFTRYSARLNYPLVRARALTLNLQAALDVEQERVRAIDPLEADISLDHLNVVRGGGDLTWYAPGGGVLSGRLIGSYGLGGRKAPPEDSDEAPLSRQGEHPVFQKLNVDLDYAQPLARHLALDVAARGQSGFHHVLAAAEQIGLAGTTGLSPVASGRVQGDSGYVLRGEARFPFATSFALPASRSGKKTETAGAALTPYVFGACGTARMARPTTMESAVTQGAAYGLGLRLGAAPDASFSAVTFSLEYGRYTLGDVLGDGSRLTFAFNLQF